jgi:hypothetical protein
MLNDGPSRYRAIADYLSRETGASVMFTFADIEAIIGERLPLGATINTTWWTSSARLHVRLWQEFGWRALPIHARRMVRFTHDAEE